MARLVEVEGYTPGREIPLGDSLVVGRDPGPNGLVVPNKEASRRHARIVRTSAGYRLQDLGSANGTLVDGSRVDSMILESGVTFTVGRTSFRFLEDADHVESGAAGPEPPRPLAASPEARPAETTSRQPRRLTYNKSTMSPATPNDVPGRPQPPPRSVTPPKLRLPPKSVQKPSPRAVWNLTLDAHATRMGYVETEARTNLRRERDVLETLCEISRTIGSILHLPALVQEILAKTLDLFPVAQNASLHILDGGNLRPIGARSRDGGRVETPVISSTIASLALTDRQSILSTDALVDERFQNKRSVILQKVRSFMCSPLLFQQEVLGVLYVDTTDARPRFTPDDLTLFTAVSAQMAVAIKNGQLLEANLREAEVRAHLSRYLPPDLVDQVLHQQIDMSPGGSLRRGTILFSDIVGFTPMSEQMGPERLVKALNRYYKFMVDAIFRHKGSVNRFGGDSIMAIWGVPVARPDDTLRAVRCAVDMQAAVFAFNLAFKDENRRPFKVGIGLNSGSFVVGNVGSERHMEYTALGNDVNVAQRVESRAAGRQVFVSSSTFRAVCNDVSAFALPPTPLKGVRDLVPIYSVRAVRDEDGETLCAVPVRFQAEALDVPAMVTRLIGGNVLEVWLEAPDEPPPVSGRSVSLRLEVPEHPDLGTVAGHAVNAAPLSERFPESGPTALMVHVEVVPEDLPSVLAVPHLADPAPGREYLERR